MFWPFRNVRAVEPEAEAEAEPKASNDHVENADGVCGNCGLDMNNVGDSKCAAAPEG